MGENGREEAEIRGKEGKRTVGKRMIRNRDRIVETKEQRISKRDSFFLSNPQPYDSPVAEAFTIMWISPLGGGVEKLSMTLCVDFNLSANSKRPPSRDLIRAASVSS